MERIPVTSSNMTSAGYEPTALLMEIEFNNGAIYQYSGVPQDVYDGFMDAASKGQYFHANIKNSYSCQKL